MSTPGSDAAAVEPVDSDPASTKKKPKRDRCSDGCDGLQCCTVFDACDLLAVLLAVILAVPQTPRVTHGPRGSRGALRLVEAYRLHVSPERPPCCNLTPTCSRYGRDALRERGLWALPSIIGRLRSCGEVARQRHASLLS